MLKTIAIRRFKSLSSVALQLGGLNLLIGTNASGKSNLLDALRVLQGIGYGFSVSEIFDGKPKSTSSIIWDGIRGGSNEILTQRRVDSGTPRTCHFEATIAINGVPVFYSIALNPKRGWVEQESVVYRGQFIYESTEFSTRSPAVFARLWTGKPGRPSEHAYEKHRPLLHQLRNESLLPEDSRAVLGGLIATLSNQQQLDLAPEVLRQYSHAPRAERIGERGENFAALVRTLLEDEKSRLAYESWLKELTPSEVENVVIKTGALGEPLFALHERGRDFPAPVLSDGTLRFAALAAALFQPNLSGLLLLEEIENGIHPTRLRLLMELLRDRTTATGIQVLTTTHSPMLLAWLKPEEYARTFLCLRDQDGTSVIRPVDQIAGFLDAIKGASFSDLFSEGWMETV